MWPQPHCATEPSCVHTQYSLLSLFGFKCLCLVTDGYTWSFNGCRACFLSAVERVWQVLEVWGRPLLCCEDHCWMLSWAAPHGLRIVTSSLHNIQFLGRTESKEWITYLISLANKRIEPVDTNKLSTSDQITRNMQIHMQRTQASAGFVKGGFSTHWHASSCIYF